MVAAGAQKKAVVVGCVAVVICASVAGIVVWQTHDSDENDQEPVPLFDSELGVYGEAAVSSDAPMCSAIGKDVLLDGGNAVDAAIATLLCVGVVQAQSMGVGGGFLGVIYNATEQTSYVLNAREKAPQGASQDMFDGNPEASQRGPLAVAVPGELKGYWELYTTHGGGVPWSRIVEPTAKMCKEGFPVSYHTANALRGAEAGIKAEPTMAEVYINKSTGNVFQLNDTITRPVLGQTLEKIGAAPTGGNILYEADSELMQLFVADLAAMNGIITEEDMTNYSVIWADPIIMNITDDLQLHTVPPPGSGIIMSFILELLSTYDNKPEVLNNFNDSVTMYHRIAEACKHAFAKRTYLGDPLVGDPEQIDQVEELVRNLTSTDYIASIRQLINDDITNNTYEYYGAEFYQPEDHGTSHVSVIDSMGNAVAVTSTINLHFGARIRSVSTGIIYNDQMDDFSSPNITNAFGVPPSPNNFIMPGKRPVSSMAPTILTDAEGRARLILGGAGGTQITTSVAYVALRTLWLNETIKEAIDARRVHHQLYPMVLRYEEGFPGEYVTALEAKNHTTEQFSLGESVVVGITVGENGTIYANSDFRKQGSVAGY